MSHLLSAVLLLLLEYAFAASPVECAAGFSAAGALVFAICGTATGVTPTVRQIAAIAHGGLFTHSHPGRNCPTFSFGDVDSAARIGLSVMRAVSHLGKRIAVAVIRHPVVIPVDVFNAELARHPSVDVPGWDAECARYDASWRALTTRYPFTYSVTVDP